MHLFVDTKRKNFVRRKSTQKSRRWRCDVPRSSIGSHTRHPICHHTINQITIACKPSSIDCLTTDLARDSAIRLRELDWHRPSASNKIVEANGKKNGLPGGNIDIPILRQIAKGLEIGEGRFNGNIHRRRTARSGGTTGLHGCLVFAEAKRKGKGQR